ncbi:hypothetical protein FOF52_17840 [Thermobifida alba]|uniref:Uncharacterized protein n=1 Tax=Thermobifida alba TaxID=53522 RepID=A0ABY4KX02_THEAE|nr:hypothetical protein [Thermobifida alba]UPT19540.1 hypothetical protein FOF52_17840 [Thermobifida alba]
MRDAFQRFGERDLPGPWDGDHERFDPKSRGPRDRYLVGMLGPRHHAPRRGESAITPDTSAGVAGEARGEEGAELPEVLPAQPLGRLWASSMGLSCRVAADTDGLVVTDGFSALWERGRLDLTVEAVVCEARFAPLFSDGELEVARKRLSQFGYPVDGAA